MEDFSCQDGCNESLTLFSGIQGPVGASTYLLLTDTTDTTYVGKAGFVPQVNVGGTALTLVELGAVAFSNDYTDLDNLPDIPTVAITDTTDIEHTVNTGAPDYNFSFNTPDTGWQNLEGFDHMSGSTVRPKLRVYGKKVYLSGQVHIPLDSVATPGTVVPLLSSTTYSNILGVTPFQGTGGVILNSDGGISFNNQTNNYAVKTSVFGTYSTPDKTYTFPIVMERRITLDSASSYTTILYSYAYLFITTEGYMTIAMLKDLEEQTTTGNTFLPSSMRFLTSKIVSGEYVPNYLNANIHSSSANGAAQALTADFSTGGGPGVKYKISCDAGREDQVGGFYFYLDGLEMFID